MIIGIIFIILIVAYIVLFNSLTTSKQHVAESWADIDVQLKRRHDLIPNLIDTVKAYAKHEKTIFEDTAEIRSKAMNLNPNDISQKAKVEDEVEKNIHQILAVSENYPDLKASENFQKLQDALTETEDEIASARRIYNENVANYNTKLGVFPTNIVANITHFQVASFFQN